MPSNDQEKFENNDPFQETQHDSFREMIHDSFQEMHQGSLHNADNLNYLFANLFDPKDLAYFKKTAQSQQQPATRWSLPRRLS